MVQPTNMKAFRIWLVLGAPVLALTLAGCGKAPKADAAQPLEQSFQTADPQVQKNIQTVTTSLNAGNYTEATRALAPIVDGRRLTEPQRQAVGVALQQINQAIAANPKLDTKEMYELRLKMFRAVDSGPRF
jgi:hypothetical protein